MADEKPLFTKEPFIEDVGPQRIKSIRFSMLSGSEICSAAEVQVYQSGFYDPTKKPIKQGLLDSHMSCARILLMEKDRKKFLKKMRSPNEDVLQKNANAKKVVEKCKASRCLHCGYINGAVKKAGSILAVAHDLSKVPNGNFDECRSAISHTKEANANFHIVNVLTPVKVLALFKKMLDEDCELLHLYDRPEKLIMTDIAVPPVAIRPSVFMDAGAMSNEDDITSKLAQVIKASAKLQEDLQSAEPPSLSLGLWEHLQVEVATYINSEVRGVPLYMQPQKPLRGVLQRLKGKQGRFRGNLSGKRVEFTGRTVISPDPNLKITEVAIPILMAKVLTYPERVSYYNMEKLRQCIRNGPQKYPGANYVITPDGSKLNLAYGNRKRLSDELKYGYIVERHLEDGDLVLFNRQPSLHRMSIMSHRARIMPWRTLRFNESVCNPYNADFDGDEMNLHVPQTEEARTEALMLMGVQNNLCTPKNGEILVASTQDFLTSSFLITRKDTFYDRAAFSLMCSYMGDGMDPIDLPTPVLIKPIELWTGKQLFSVLIRPHARMRVYLNLTLTEKNYDKGKDKKTMCPNDGYVYFRNSELLCGQLGKATLGNGNKDGLFSVLLRDYGAHAAASCMNRLAKLSARWIGNHGFSIGIDDVQPGEHLNRNKKVEIDKGYKECDDLINRFNTGGLKLLPGCNAAQTLESNITGKLNNIREAAAKVCMASLHWRNSPLIMSQCGSKGSPINISQMVACVGQQSVGGRRAPNGFIDRSLPHFPINSKTPAAKGFVANSFYTGLTATEFFFHTMGGREGLVDTAVKTAETGYMSRRLMKSLEDLSTYYDETVRNSSGGIVQLLYGDDGMDPAAMEGKEGMPLNLDRLFMKTKATFPATRAHTSLSPSEIFKAADDRLSKHDVTPEGGCSAAFKESLSDFLKKSVVALRKTRRELGLDEDKVGEHVLENVAANISGITSQQLQVFLETCIHRYHLKRLEAGAAIGAIGAQSIGEPGTQMTLKTFHFAGVASMNVTLGVPRIREIINAVKKIGTPIITATLVCDNDVHSARIVKGRIEKTILGEVAKSLKVSYLPRREFVSVKLDKAKIEDLQMKISAYTVAQSILQHPKIKLKQQHIEILSPQKLKLFPPEADKYTLRFKLDSLKKMLLDVIVEGIPTVERAVINHDKEKNKFNLLIEGTNLRAVMGTPGVDGRKTKSNHIIEIEQTLGIEAARKCIIDEIKYTMQTHGMSIDIRHMMLLADVMTFKGQVLGITNAGIAKMKDSVLMLASFEKTGEHLFNASIRGRIDQIEGVSECIIMGIPMQIGTGILKVKQRDDPVQVYNRRPDLIMG
ncbi:DNA-directed RNA polymerase III subunit 1 isoform X2 [Magnolia sinica]|uniref:DNA-directed RNA polymerase III subunit 1 isoform X2 n=1 Tax=Magnolia sinica TaxID=86752 RepID=UPI002657BD3F|nr:DNA-directed RNA polymerase III subunit 1 isoform X2 [Magnolia sinica]